MHHDKDTIGPASAILLGDYKLIRVYATGARQLFNIAQDPAERRDLAAQMPDKVKELDARLTDYLQAVNAQMPMPRIPPHRVDGYLQGNSASRAEVVTGGFH